MRIEGYAVVGDDDRIADADGLMPDILRNDAEWAFFQEGLDAADIVVLGRRSHDITPNPRRRRRLVLTRSVASIEREVDAVFWNPSGASSEAAVEAFGCSVQHIAVASIDQPGRIVQAVDQLGTGARLAGQPGDAGVGAAHHSCSSTVGVADTSKK